MAFKIIRANSFTRLQKMDANSVDVTITDPPFDRHVHATHSHKNQRNGFRASGAIPFSPLQSYEFVLELLRVSRRWVVCFCSFEQFAKYREASFGAYCRGAIWHKYNGIPQFTGDRPGQCGEGIAVMHKHKRMSRAIRDGLGEMTARRWNGRGKHGYYRYGKPSGRQRVGHVAEKPVDLCRQLVLDYSEPGETVFDPFCGAGSIGVAAILEGRSYLGIDNNKEWVEKSRMRLSNTTPNAIETKKCGVRED